MFPAICSPSPRRQRCRTAVLGPDCEPYRPRHVSLGQGVDGGGRSGMVRDGVGPRGTTVDYISDVA